MNVTGGLIRVSILHACGHKRRTTACPGESLDEWKQKLEESDCPACWLKKQPPRFRLRTRQHGGYAIDVSRGYPLKEVLRERGYFFQRPQWIKLFSTVRERQLEIDWIWEYGYEVVGDD